MNLAEYIKETRGEMSHVSWPSRKQAISYAVAVVVVSVVTSLLLALADFVFSKLLTLVV